MKKSAPQYADQTASSICKILHIIQKAKTNNIHNYY